MHSRSAWLLGEAGMRHLARCRVAVIGLGGVGGMAAEALARGGIGHLLLVDADRVAPANINRQIVALHSTVGRLKTAVMQERLADINPDLRIDTHPLFVPATGTDGLLDGCDYVLDAIDTVPSKVGLILECKSKGIPILSCMGAGNRLQPAQFTIADLFSTTVDPLCRVMRRRLRRAGVDQLTVVYSPEPPVRPQRDAAEVNRILPQDTGGKHPPGSVSFGPPAAGLVAAGHIILTLLAADRSPL